MASMNRGRVELFVLCAFAWVSCGPRTQEEQSARAAPAVQAVATQAAQPVPPPKSCEACRNRYCRDYRGEGVDLVAGCFEHVDRAKGAVADPAFNAACARVVQCAIEHDCATDPARGIAPCYCGSHAVDECIADGPAGDAPCVEAWKAATRGASNREILERMDKPEYPAGWAFHLLECDRDFCGSSSRDGRCTPETEAL
jgi:hypothetical protein